MLLYSERRAPSSKPSWLALGVTPAQGGYSFELLNVDEELPAGALPAYYLAFPSAQPERIVVTWPGLRPGLYRANRLEMYAD